MDSFFNILGNALSAVQTWADGLISRLTNTQILFVMLAMLVVIVVLVALLVRKSHQYEDAMDEIDEHGEAMLKVKQEAQTAVEEGEKLLQERMRALEEQASDRYRPKAAYQPPADAEAEARRVLGEAREYALKSSQRADLDRAEIIANATREANVIRDMANAIFQRANEAFKLAQERANADAFEARAPEHGGTEPVARHCEDAAQQAAPEVEEGAVEQADSPAPCAE